MTLSQESTLILCSSMPDALIYAREAKNRGERVVASSSLKYDEGAKDYDVWEWLPSVYEEGFLEALETMVARHRVTRIYCPHNIAHMTLSQLKKEGKLTLPIIGLPPIAIQTQATKNLICEADEAKNFICQIAHDCALPEFRIAAILRQTELTYGESHPSKLAAMMAAFSQLPPGDIVEIGSYWGKTAVALIMLAHQFKAGPVLCVDPWKLEEGIQKDSPALMQTMPNYIDWDVLFSGFIRHVAAVETAGMFNYIRLPSIKAETLYRSNPVIRSPEFGKVEYKGTIALIHIDGNHDYESVKSDYDAWRPHMAPGGWIILDDYVWLHGDGPKILGDAILKTEKLKCSFTAGKALFLQLA